MSIFERRFKNVATIGEIQVKNSDGIVLHCVNAAMTRHVCASCGQGLPSFYCVEQNSSEAQENFNAHVEDIVINTNSLCESCKSNFWPEE